MHRTVAESCHTLAYNSDLSAMYVMQALCSKYQQFSPHDALYTMPFTSTSGIQHSMMVFTGGIFHYLLSTGGIHCHSVMYTVLHTTQTVSGSFNHIPSHLMSSVSRCYKRLFSSIVAWLSHRLTLQNLIDIAQGPCACIKLCSIDHKCSKGWAVY